MREYASRRLRATITTAAIVLAVLLAFTPDAVSAQNVSARLQSAAPVAVELCFIPASFVAADRVLARHARFAVEWLRPRYAGRVNASLRYVQRGGGPTVNAVAEAVLRDGGGCDAFVGPQTSSLSLALAPLIARPWVSHTASSTRLSEGQPWFARVIPSDSFAGAGMADALGHFGWRAAHAVCSDEPYGQGALSSFSKRFRENGGSLRTVRCFVSDANETTLRGIVDALAADASAAAVAMAVPQSSPVLPALLRLIAAAGLHERLVFIFSESTCTGHYAGLALLPGALCVSYGVRAAAAAAYDAAWAAHDPGALFGDFPALGFPPVADPFATSLLAYFVADAVWLALEAASAAAAAYGAAGVRDAATLRSFVRRAQPAGVGVTGPLEIDAATGDRGGLALLIQNVQPAEPSAVGANGRAFRLVTFAEWTAAGGYAARAGVDPGRDLHWLGRANASVPPPMDASQRSRADEHDLALPSTTVMVVLLAVIVTFAATIFVVFKLGLGDLQLLALLLRTGVATRTPVAVANVGLIVAAAAATESTWHEAFHHDDGSAKWKHARGCAIAFAAVSTVTIPVLLAEVGTIAWFLVRFARTIKGEFDPREAARWRATLSRVSCVAVCAAKAPLALVAALALLLVPARNEPALAAAIIAGLLVGGACDDFADAWASLRTDPAALQAQLAEFVGAEALSQDSEPEELAAAYEFVARADAERFRVLLATAKHVVVELQTLDVGRGEFFAVVWPFMADVYQFALLHGFGAELLAGLTGNRAGNGGDGDGDDSAPAWASQSTGQFTSIAAAVAMERTSKVRRKTVRYPKKSQTRSPQVLAGLSVAPGAADEAGSHNGDGASLGGVPNDLLPVQGSQSQELGVDPGSILGMPGLVPSQGGGSSGAVEAARSRRWAAADPASDSSEFTTSMLMSGSRGSPRCAQTPRVRALPPPTPNPQHLHSQSEQAETTSNPASDDDNATPDALPAPHLRVYPDIDAAPRTTPALAASPNPLIVSLGLTHSMMRPVTPDTPGAGDSRASQGDMSSRAFSLPSAARTPPAGLNPGGLMPNFVAFAGASASRLSADKDVEGAPEEPCPSVRIVVDDPTCDDVPK